MPLTTPRELFVHELSDAMSAEQQILKMLPELQNEALNHELQEALKTHEEETQQQVRNIQEVFRQLGETPEATTCYAVKGLDEEHKALLKEQPSPEILEMANLGAASKTEHYEMAMYTVSSRWPRISARTKRPSSCRITWTRRRRWPYASKPWPGSLASCRPNTWLMAAGPAAAASPPPAPGEPGHRDGNSSPVQTTRRPAVKPIDGWSIHGIASPVSPLPSSTRFVLSYGRRTRLCRSDGEGGDNARIARHRVDFRADGLWITRPHLPSSPDARRTRGVPIHAQPSLNHPAHPRLIPVRTGVVRSIALESTAVIHIRCPLIHISPSSCDPATRPVPEIHASFRADQGCARR